MNSLLTYIVYGIFGGPALALAYGLREFTPLFCFIVLSLTYILSVLVIHLILSKIGLEYRFRNKIFHKASAMLKERGSELAMKVDDICGRFKKDFGDLGFYLALASFTFVFGVYWAGLVAFMLKIDLLRAMSSISLGAVLSVAFWTYITLEQNLDPETVTLFFLLLTILFIIYGMMKENKTLRRVTGKILQDLGRGSDIFKRLQK